MILRAGTPGSDQDGQLDWAGAPEPEARSLTITKKTCPIGSSTTSRSPRLAAHQVALRFRLRDFGWRRSRLSMACVAARRHVRTPHTYCARQPDRRTIAIRGAACSIRLVARNSVHVRRLWAGLAVDELPSGNHRRGRAGATPGGGAYGAYRCATNGGGGWGPGHTGNVGAAHTSRPFAILRKVQPPSPSACRAVRAAAGRRWGVMTSEEE